MQDYSVFYSVKVGLSLREEHRLSVLENTVLKVLWAWRRIRCFKICTVHPILLLWSSKGRRDGRDMQYGSGRWEIHTKFYPKNLKTPL